MVGRTLGNEAVGPGVYVALVGFSNGGTDGRTGNEGAALGVGVLWSITTGTAVTSTFMATNTPAMPMPMIMKTGTVSRARSTRDFFLSLIDRVCRTQPRRAAGPTGRSPSRGLGGLLTGIGLGRERRVTRTGGALELQHLSHDLFGLALLEGPGLERLEYQETARRLVGIEQEVDQVRLRDFGQLAVEHRPILHVVVAESLRSKHHLLECRPGWALGVLPDGPILAHPFGSPELRKTHVRGDPFAVHERPSGRRYGRVREPLTVMIPDPTPWWIVGPEHVKSMLPSEAFGLPSSRPCPAASATSSPHEGLHPSSAEPLVTRPSQLAFFSFIVDVTSTRRRSPFAGSMKRKTGCQSQRVLRTIEGTRQASGQGASCAS